MTRILIKVTTTATAAAFKFQAAIIRAFVGRWGIRVRIGSRIGGIQVRAKAGVRGEIRGHGIGIWDGV